MLDFLELIMEPESTRRLTPNRALHHRFLRESAPGVPEEADVVPHAPGHGACGSLHFQNESKEHCAHVKVPGREGWVVKRLRPGEGVPIGKEPCELHRDIELPQTSKTASKASRR